MIAAVLGIDPAALFKYHVATQWPKPRTWSRRFSAAFDSVGERDWITFFKEVGIVEPPRAAEKRVRLVLDLVRRGMGRRGGGPVKALSIRQPWASLIIAGHKRSRRVLGRRLTRSEDSASPSRRRSPCRRSSAAAEEEAFQRHSRATGFPALEQLPMGSVLGTVIVAGCRCIDPEFLESLDDQEEAFGIYAPDRFAWLLEDPQPLEKPVPVCGAQGLWEWSQS